MKKQRIENYILKGVFLFLVVVSVFALNAAAPAESGEWKYAVNGREIFNEGFFPEKEKFSYAYEADFEKKSWLFAVFSHSVFRILGENNVYIARFVMIMILFSALFMTVYKRQQGKYVSVIIPAALTGFYLLAVKTGMTPETISYIFLAYVIYIFEHQ
ncbi:MAG TPA: hypothetical protein ENN55_05155, partial [Firmicutes bacterium]|nr:hypothetical protein [Bacillota bacterium]